MTSEVRVTIPATARFLRIARLTAAGVAGDAGFDLREIEDLRVAVDEMCAVVIEDAPDGAELELSYQSRDGHLEIEGSCAQSGPPPDIHPIAARAAGHDRRRVRGRLRRPGPHLPVGQAADRPAGVSSPGPTGSGTGDGADLFVEYAPDP